MEHQRAQNLPQPGLSVRQDCFEPLGLTITEGAAALGVTRQTLNNLVNCKTNMAIGPDKAFGGGAETWLRLQMADALRRLASARATSRSSPWPDARCPSRTRDR